MQNNSEREEVIGTSSPGPRRSSVLLVGEDRASIDDLAYLLDPHFDIVGRVSPCSCEVINAARRLNPDVVVLDLPEPTPDEVETARQLKLESPDARLILVTLFVNAIILGSAFWAGAHGYIVRERAGCELVDAVREVINGRTYVSPGVGVIPPQALKTAAPIHDLTARERDVLRLTGQGKTAKEVATALNISPRTVGFHKSNIMTKLGLHTIAELASIAAFCGMTGCDKQTL